MSFTYAKSSLVRLEKAHPKLKKVFMLAKEKCEIDFDISWTYRSPAIQKELFDEGRSPLDGINNMSKHNSNPSLAVDVYAYTDDWKTDYSPEKMELISKAVKASAKELNVKIEWGGDWKKFIDKPHYELV